MDTLVRIGVVLAANAVALIVAALLFDKVTIEWGSFLVLLLVFSFLALVAPPLIRKAADRWASGGQRPRLADRDMAGPGS
jgi:hypothetical protein